MERLFGFLSAMSVVFVYAIAAIVFLQIPLRWFDVGLFWTAEVAQLLCIWTVFVLIPELGSRSKHLHVDFFYERAEGTTRDGWDGLVLLVSLLTVFALTLSGFSVTQIAIGGQSPAGLPLPVYYVGAAFGLALLTVVYGTKLPSTLRRIGGRA